ncbi:MAG: plasmid stabilization protein [Flavipsychrobacter sp.]|jgi:plasmid stabilization system protein ParE|nr:plasmid stabilization protein [Flavipsychrobacter sp.]
MKITWASRALKQFNDAISYIREDSDQNADSVKEKILSKIGSLAEAPVVHRKDEYKRNNDGRFHYLSC